MKFDDNENANQMTIWQGILDVHLCCYNGWLACGIFPESSIVKKDIFKEVIFFFTLKIVMKDGKSLGYGIIEYKSWQEAEKSERHLNSHKILDVPMRITYCIPGISAVTICSRLMSKFVSTHVLVYQYIRHVQTEAIKVKFCPRLSENERITMVLVVWWTPEKLETVDSIL